jgi:hypothetical protein
VQASDLEDDAKKLRTRLHRFLAEIEAITPWALLVSPERALAILRLIQTHRVHMPNNRTVTVISTIDVERSAIFDSLGANKPTATDSNTGLQWSGLT